MEKKKFYNLSIDKKKKEKMPSRREKEERSTYPNSFKVMEGSTHEKERGLESSCLYFLEGEKKSTRT